MQVSFELYDKIYITVKNIDLNIPTIHFVITKFTDFRWNLGHKLHYLSQKTKKTFAKEMDTALYRLGRSVFF